MIHKHMHGTLYIVVDTLYGELLLVHFVLFFLLLLHGYKNYTNIEKYENVCETLVLSFLQCYYFILCIYIRGNAKLSFFLLS